MAYMVMVFRQQALSLRFSKGFSALLITIPVLVSVLLVLVSDPLVMGWHTRLMPGDAVERVFPLSDVFFQGPDLDTYLLVDTDPPFDTDNSRLQITVNGMPLNTRQVFPLGLEIQKYLTGDGFVPVARFRQYRFYPVPAEVMNVLQQAHVADIRLNVPALSPPIDVYGDYPMAGDNQYRIPTPDWSYFSIYKVFYDHDGRLPTGLLPAAPETKNLWLHNGKPSGVDLSSSPGLQAGQFRILFLRLQPHDGEDKGYPMAQYHQDAQGHIYRTLGVSY